jgi:hypothetical protein
MFVADTGGLRAGQVHGNGHCVALVQALAGAPHTSLWRPGPLVWLAGLDARGRPGGARAVLAAGTAIATFSGPPPGGRYENATDGRSHAALFLAWQGEAVDADGGMWVWDQWRGSPAARRLVRQRAAGATAANRADAYRVITLEQISGDRPP